MTLLPKNRDMPTLSLKGSVCVSMFLFIFVLSQIIPNPLFAQDFRNRTENMYRLGTVIISSESLPDKVYEAQKNKFLITVIFFEKDTDNIITSSVGTGFISNHSGVVVTARHLLTEAMREADALKVERIKTNPKFNYEYVFMGTIITPNQWLNFPLFLAATGEAGTMKDIMALRADVATMEKARDSGDLVFQNPLQRLLRTSEFVDAKLGEKVYITGFAPIVVQYSDKNNKLAPVYIDLINHTFSAEVELPIPGTFGNRTGVKILYRLRDGAEPGFSGGKVLNSRGQIIGMTIATSFSRNFIYAISSKDIEDFLKDNKL